MRYFNVLLFVGFTFANIYSMEISTKTISKLRLHDLPEEILNYIASFLTFPNKENDEEFEERVRIIKKRNYLLIKKTPVGKIGYVDRGSYPYHLGLGVGYYLIQNGRSQTDRLLKDDLFKSLVPCRGHQINHVYSQNGKFLLVAHIAYYNAILKIGEQETFIDICDINNQKIIRSHHFTGAEWSYPFAVSNDGNCTVIYNKTDKTINFKLSQCKDLICQKIAGDIIALDFNKQNNKLGILTTKGFNILEIINETQPLSKTMAEYFRLMGVCKNFPHYDKKTALIDVLKKYRYRFIKLLKL